MSRKNVRFSFGDPDQPVPIQEERRKSYPKETRWSKGYTSKSSNEKRKIPATEIRKDVTGASEQSITPKSEERKIFHKEKRWNDGHPPEDSNTVRGETREEHSTAISSTKPKRRVSFSSDVRDPDEIRRSSYSKEWKWLMGFAFPPRLGKNKSYPRKKRGYISGTSKHPTPTLEEETLNKWKRRVSFSTDVPDESFFDKKQGNSYPKETKWTMGFALSPKLGKKKQQDEELSGRPEKTSVTRIVKRGTKVRFSFDDSEASRPFFATEPRSSFPKEKRWGKSFTAERKDSAIGKNLERKEGSHLDVSGTTGTIMRHRAIRKIIRKRRSRWRKEFDREPRVWNPRQWIARDKLRYSESLIIDDQLYNTSDDGFLREPSVYVNVDFRGQKQSREIIEWFREFWDFVHSHPEIRPSAKGTTYNSQDTQTEITGLSAEVDLSPAVDYSEIQAFLNTGVNKVAKLIQMIPYVTPTIFAPERYPWLWRKVCMKYLGLDKNVLTPSSKEPVVRDDRVWADEVLEDFEEVVRKLPHLEPAELTEAFRKHIYVQDMLRKNRNPTFHRQLGKLKFTY